ncbi:DUF3341 domain-containing protein [Candidatus Neomarinimicrobiota bacterium]
MAKPWAILAEFPDPTRLISAAEKLRDTGFKNFDCHSPFPVHGMDRAMGLKRSPLGYIVGLLCVIGAAVGLGLQSWVHTIEYPLIIAGKPFFSWQAFTIITFALLVLFGAFGAVVGMLSLSRLPQLHHPLFNSENFHRFSRDAFFISVESSDPLFDEKKICELLTSLGGTNLELIEEESS